MKKKILFLAKVFNLEKAISSGQLLCDSSLDVCVEYFPVKQVFRKREIFLFEKLFCKHQKKNPDDFNGKVLSLFLLKIEKGVIFLKLRPSDFATYFVTRTRRLKYISCFTNRRIFDHGSCMPVSIGAIAVTKSTAKNPFGCLVVAIRGKTAFEEGSLTFLPGGYLNSEDVIDGEEVSLARCIYRELEEELGIYEVDRMQFLGIAYSKVSRQPMIMIQIDLLQTREELEEILIEKSEIIDKENKKIFIIDNSSRSILEFLKLGNICVHDAWKLILFLLRLEMWKH